MTDDSNNILIENIKDVIQKIQDKTVPRTELGTFDMRYHHLYWKLGTLIKQYVELNKIPKDRIESTILEKFRNIEKKIRNSGERKGKEPFPTWYMESKQTKKIRPPKKPWVQLCWQFVYEFQDEERWNLVADLAGHKFKDKDGNTLFVRKRAEDLLQYFSKENPIPNAKELQEIFIKKFSRFDRNPSRESEWEPLKQQVFGRAKVDIILAKENFSLIHSEVEEAIESDSSYEVRKEFLKSVGNEGLESLRRLFRLIRITDDEMFERRLKQLGSIPRTIKTKHSEIKELYQILYPLIKDSDSRKKLLVQITPYDLTVLNTKLKAVSSELAYSEYQKNQKLREELFN